MFTRPFSKYVLISPSAPKSSLNFATNCSCIVIPSIFLYSFHHKTVAEITGLSISVFLYAIIASHLWHFNSCRAVCNIFTKSGIEIAYFTVDCTHINYQFSPYNTPVQDLFLLQFFLPGLLFSKNACANISILLKTVAAMHRYSL